MFVYVLILVAFALAKENEPAPEDVSQDIKSSSPVQQATPQPSHIPEPAPYLNNARVGCTGNTVRKEVREMKADGDWDGYVTAFKTMATDGSLAEYINIHHSWGGQWHHIHATSRFLPWHRAYIKFFEIELQARGAKYLPYWDSATGIFLSLTTR